MWSVHRTGCSRIQLVPGASRSRDVHLVLRLDLSLRQSRVGDRGRLLGDVNFILGLQEGC